MNWVRPIHRWVIDPICWFLADMLHAMIVGKISCTTKNVVFWVRVLVMLSPRGEEVIIEQKI